MTPEQQRAVDLATKIGELGGFVVSIVPPDDLVVRFQVVADASDKVIATLREEGWEPTRIGTGPRFMPLGNVIMVNSYAVRIPHERVAVQDDGKQYFGELSKGKKAPSEADVMAASLTGKR
jgi:hypothetical protein